VVKDKAGKTHSGTIEVESRNQETGENTTKIDGTVEGEDIELNFNSKYITDCMQSIPSDSLVLNFGGVGKPLTINGASDKSFLYIVMPIRQ